MGVIKNLKIFFKILLIIINIFVFMILQAVVMVNGLNAQKILLKELTEKRFYLYETTSEILFRVLTLDREFELILLKNSEGIPPGILKDYRGRLEQDLNPLLLKIEEVMEHPDLSEEERLRFKDALSRVDSYKKIVISISTLGQLGGGRAIESTRIQAKKISAEIRESLTLLREYESSSISDLKIIAEQQLDQQSWFFLVICLFAFIIPLVISYFIARAIISPIQHLVNYSQSVAGGDLRRSYEFKSRDEVGNLSDYINKVVIYIKNFIKNMKDMQVKNVELKNELVASTSETFAATTEISSNLSSSVQLLDKLNENVDSSVEMSEDISVIFEVFTHKIDEQASSVTKSSSSINHMIDSVKNVARMSSHRTDKSKELLTLTEKGIEKMEESNKKVKEMSIISDNILEAINIIEDISERTNLLSVNSAIQAAHAGEAGKSFKVVANEIRRLAESSSDSSKSISTNLKRNVEMMKELLDASNESSQFFHTIEDEVKLVVSTLKEISGATTNLTKAGNEIAGVIDGLNKITGEVESNSVQIYDKIKNVKTTILNVEGITSEVINAITEINLGAEQINSAMALLNNNAVLLEDRITETSKSVDQFLIS